MAASPYLTQVPMAGRSVALQIVLRLFAAFAVVTGLLDVLTGTRLLIGAGAQLSGLAANDPVLNSQIKFLGVIWAGCGAAVWWAAGDLRSRQGVVQNPPFLGYMRRAETAGL